MSEVHSFDSLLEDALIGKKITKKIHDPDFREIPNGEYIGIPIKSVNTEIDRVKVNDGTEQEAIILALTLENGVQLYLIDWALFYLE